MTGTVHFPAGRSGPLLTIAESAARSGAELAYGDERVRHFLTELAAELTAAGASGSDPELASLAFFLRRAALRRALADVADGPDRLRVPRGLVFHVAPANVPVLFMYSWALSALVGNANVVRVPARAGRVAGTVLDAAERAAARSDDVVRRTQVVLGYDHDDALSTALSRVAQARVIWGGDTTVATFRALPAAPAGHDIVFPDRYSAAVFSADGWAGAGEAGRVAAARALHHDVFQHDQNACSSPLTLFWIGDAAAAAAAGRSLAERWDALGRSGPPDSAAMQIERRVRVLGLAVEGRVATARFDRTPVTVTLSPAAGVLDRWCGAGVLAVVRLDTVDDLPPLLDRRVQTLTHFGLQTRERDRLARLAAPRGVDRVVPVGDALTFDPVWDGYDLIRELSRVVTVR